MSKGIPISFFFVQIDDAKSLGAASILRCLMRQRLTEEMMPKNIEDQLQHCIGIRLLAILNSLSKKRLMHIVIPIICPKSERDIVLANFKLLMSSTGATIKLYVSSR